MCGFLFGAIAKITNTAIQKPLLFIFLGQVSDSLTLTYSHICRFRTVNMTCPEIPGHPMKLHLVKNMKKK